MVSDAERRVWRLGVGQHGMVSRRQALALGMTPGQIARRVRSREWTLLKPGLYLLPGHTTTLRGMLAAATAALGAVVSHQSAAELLGIPYVQRGLAVVTVPIRTTNRFPDVVVHQSTDLSPGCVIEIDHLPVTTALRTVIDLSAILRVGRLDRIIEKCVVDRRFTLQDLRTEFERLSRHGKPGMSKLRLVLDSRMPGFTPCASDLESMMADALRAWGYPEPVRQFPLPWRSPKAGRVDFAYPHLRLIIEVDGRAWHTLAGAFDEDRMRDNLAQLAQWRVIRITYRMLVESPEEVRLLIGRALGVSRPEPPRKAPATSI